MLKKKIDFLIGLDIRIDLTHVKTNANEKKN